MDEIIFSAHSPKVESANYPGYKVEFKIEKTDLNIREYLVVFNNFLKSLGFNDYTIINGELQTAIDMDHNDPKVVDEILESVGLVDSSKIFDIEQKHKEELDKYKAEIIKLKADISRLRNPSNLQYTDEELNAMEL